jgi:hypothetical protein
MVASAAIAALGATMIKGIRKKLIAIFFLDLSVESFRLKEKRRARLLDKLAASDPGPNSQNGTPRG